MLEKINKQSTAEMYLKKKKEKTFTKPQGCNYKCVVLKGVGNASAANGNALAVAFFKCTAA